MDGLKNLWHLLGEHRKNIAATVLQPVAPLPMILLLLPLFNAGLKWFQVPKSCGEQAISLAWLMQRKMLQRHTLHQCVVCSRKGMQQLSIMGCLCLRVFSSHPKWSKQSSPGTGTRRKQDQSSAVPPGTRCLLSLHLPAAAPGENAWCWQQREQWRA